MGTIVCMFELLVCKCVDKCVHMSMYVCMCISIWECVSVCPYFMSLFLGMCLFPRSVNTLLWLVCVCVCVRPDMQSVKQLCVHILLCVGRECVCVCVHAVSRAFDGVAGACLM